MHVEIDAFSGRPNPAWDLSPEETREFLTMLESSPPGPAGEDQGGLGYRGITITAARPLASMPARVRVGGGAISVTFADGKTQHRRDDRGIEQWLLRKASEHGYQP